MSASTLSNAIMAQFNATKWKTGVSIWQYSSDPTGSFISAATSKLIAAINSSSTQNNTNSTNSTNSTTNNSTNSSGNSTSNTTNSTNASNLLNITYPIRLVYFNRINDWSSPAGVAKSMGIPGYAVANLYNYYVFSFWTYNGGPVDVVKVWSNPSNYLGTLFGSTDN
jgi:hypothetical protein